MALNPANPAVAPRKLRREVSVFIDPFLLFLKVNSTPMRAAPLGTSPNATPSRAAALSQCLSLTPLLRRSPTTRHSLEVRDATACKHAAATGVLSGSGADSSTEPRNLIRLSTRLGAVSASTAEGSVQCDDGQDSVGISVDQDTGGLRALPHNGSAGGVERRYPSLARILVRGGAHRARVGGEVPRHSGSRGAPRLHAAPLRAPASRGLGLR